MLGSNHVPESNISCIPQMEQHEPKGQILEIATNIYLLPWQPIASPIITSTFLSRHWSGKT